MHFVAIDFETANARRSSACSLGYAIVKNGHCVEADQLLIKPYPSDFHWYNVKIHGITAADVIDAPNFLSVWHSVSKRFKGLPLVAHNAAFDMSVIRQSLDQHAANYPTHDYLCTLSLAKAALPEQNSYRLNALCAHFGIPLKHHDAKSDATACALLLLKICDVLKIKTLPELLAQRLISCGTLHKSGYRPCRQILKHTRKTR